jgi:hypothetical protein
VDGRPLQRFSICDLTLMHKEVRGICKGLRLCVVVWVSRCTPGLAFHGCGGVEFAHATTIEVLLSVLYAFAGVRSRSRLAGERESSEPRREPSAGKRSTRKVSLCLTFSVAVQQ